MSVSEEDVPSYLLQRYHYQVGAGNWRGTLGEWLRLQHLVWKTNCAEDAREWSLSRWLYEEKKRRG